MVNGPLIYEGQVGERRLTGVLDGEHLGGRGLDLDRAEVPLVRVDRDDALGRLARALEARGVGQAAVGRHGQGAGIGTDLVGPVADPDVAGVSRAEAGGLVAVAVIGDDGEIIPGHRDDEPGEGRRAGVGHREGTAPRVIDGDVAEVVARWRDREAWRQGRAGQGHVDRAVAGVG